MSSFQALNQKLKKILQEPDFIGNEEQMKNDETINVELHNVKIPILRKKAGEYQELVIQWCESYPDQEKIKEGASCIEMSVELGSQKAALNLFALGQIFGIWRCAFSMPKSTAKETFMCGYKKTSLGEILFGTNSIWDFWFIWAVA